MLSEFHPLKIFLFIDSFSSSNNIIQIINIVAISVVIQRISTKLRSFTSIRQQRKNFISIWNLF